MNAERKHEIENEGELVEVPREGPSEEQEINPGVIINTPIPEVDEDEESGEPPERRPDTVN